MIQVFFALLIGKIISLITKTFQIGGGSAAPGLYALKTDPQLIQRLASQIPTNIIITGTNGKTTTARLLNHLLTKQGLKVVRNATGSNLERGIASSLLIKASFWGEIKNVDVGIWEVDEAAFNTLLPKLKPSVVVFLNAFRDQLDRYGEVDTVVKKWWKTLSDVNWPLQIITNLADINTSYLRDISMENGQIQNLSYQVKDHFMYREVSQFTELKKDQKPDIQAKITKQRGLNGSDFSILYPQGELKIELNLPGVYNIYNCLAAFSVYYSLNLSLDQFAKHLADFSPAFGRVERLNFKGKELVLFLIKNPVGATQVLETVMPLVEKTDVLLTALNDNFADGKDVSWIWDAEFELLTGKQEKGGRGKGEGLRRKAEEFGHIVVSGIRAYDLAVRLKYAQISAASMTVEPNLSSAFDQAMEQTKSRMFMLLTYTAMLEIQKILSQRGAKKEYWRE